MTTTEAVSIRLTKLLAEKKLSQYALAKKATIDPSNIYNIMYGRCKTVTLDMLILICEGLDITVQEFLNDPIFDRNNFDI